VSARRLLDVTLVVGILDALLLAVLVYVAFIDRSDAAVSAIGPVHGIGYVLLVALTAYGARERHWDWWFPAIVVGTGGPLGTVIGDVILRRRLRTAPQPS